MGQNDPQTILNIAATAEVLATIVNTVSPDQVRRRTPNPGGVTTRKPS